MMSKVLSIFASVFMLIVGLPNLALALNFNQISQVVFFGDSLTDSGFNDLWPTVAAPPTIPPLSAGKAPTFTTYGGFTWAQYVARDIKGYVLPVSSLTPSDLMTNNYHYPVPGFSTGSLTGINYAAGGSTTSSTGVVEIWAPALSNQVYRYLATSGPVLDPNAVYFIWAGANDILKLLFSAPPVPTQLQFLTAASVATTNIANQVALLSSRGAKRIVVLSLPNIGYTPLIKGISELYHLPTLPADMKNLTFTFNSMLNMALGRVIAQYHVKVLYVDVYTMLDNVIRATQAGVPYVVAGQSFKFVNYTDPACGPAPSAIYCQAGAPTNYVFADSLHPTDMAHRALSLQVETQILQWQ